jgi:diguanylate cyclase (GGDEF)-like protein
VICPDTSPAQALVLAQHVLAAVRAMRMPHVASPVAPYVTASIGVGAADADCPDVEALLAAADAALYEAKRRGRDRAHGAGQGAEESVSGDGTANTS